jgi:hypothetical protein
MACMQSHYITSLVHYNTVSVSAESHSALDRRDTNSPTNEWRAICSALTDLFETLLASRTAYCKS